MGLGRRSAPAAPPMPSRPLPPSAYGIAVPGAPLAPAVSYTPPPSSPPAPVGAYPPPAPLEPTIEYGSAAPTEAAASRFGGYAGPADPFAAPPAEPFAAPPVPYGAPAWSTTPPKRKRTRLWAKVLGGLFLAVVGLGVVVHLYDAATLHHIVGSMPATIQDTSLDSSAQAQSAVAAAIAKEQTSGIQDFQAGIYRGSPSILVADMGEVPANSGAFRAGLVNSFLGGETGSTVTSVTPGKQGGTESCAALATGVACLWIDDGTVGAVIVLKSTDMAAAQAYLQTFRDQVEH